MVILLFSFLLPPSNKLTPSTWLQGPYLLWMWRWSPESSRPSPEAERSCGPSRGRPRWWAREAVRARTRRPPRLANRLSNPLLTPPATARGSESPVRGLARGFPFGLPNSLLRPRGPAYFQKGLLRTNVTRTQPAQRWVMEAAPRRGPLEPQGDPRPFPFLLCSVGLPFPPLSPSPFL